MTGPWDEDDTQEWADEQYDEKSSISDVKSAWHGARNDAQDSGRDTGADRTSDWDRDRSEK